MSMTEMEWLTASDPKALLWHVGNQATERSRRLFECACCRRVWHELADDRSRRAIEVAENHADGLAMDAELEAAALQADKAWPQDDDPFGPEGRLPAAAAAYNVAIPMGWWGGAPAFLPPSSIVQAAARNLAVEQKEQAALLRDIFGNPFRPIALLAEWRTETAVALARRMYQSRDFSAMPDLSDTLEAATCDNEYILDHCRSSGPHVRGCWVIDLLLGWK